MNFSWVNSKLTIAECAIGKGQIATQEIAQGELLAVFGGFVMTLEEFYQLPIDIQNFAIQINESPDLLLGPRSVNELSNGDYCNHSCNPNAGFRGTVQLEAMRVIKTGEEVTFDYATCITADFGDMPCACNEPNCRQFVSGEDWKRPELQRRYAGYWQPYISQKIMALGKVGDP